MDQLPIEAVRKAGLSLLRIGVPVVGAMGAGAETVVAALFLLFERALRFWDEAALVPPVSAAAALSASPKGV